MKDIEKEKFGRRSTDLMGRVKNVHFIGIGGSGMGGIAEVLINIGYSVSGSDIQENAVTRRLVEKGATVTLGHKEENVAGVDAVVVSSAIDKSNPEIVAAKDARIPIVPRAEMLAELMRFRFGIAIAGTHGKTTTTSLVASILAEADLDPTYVIGGRLNSSARHAKLGAGQYLVAEADESDASFLYLQPVMAVVTNIDADHLATYDGDFEKLKETFIDFLHQLPFYGLAVVCNENETIREILPQITKPYLAYGFNSDADIRAFDVEQSGTRISFKVEGKDIDGVIAITLNLPGQHNVLNALAAIAIAIELGVSEKDIQAALSGFQGIGRRFQINAEYETEGKKITFVDDYGHHPKELEATIAAARASWPDRRLMLVFQPHRYSRTRDLMEDFVKVLSEIDLLILTEVYAAGEEKIIGAEGRDLVRAVRARGTTEPIFAEDVSEVGSILKKLVEPGDVVLTMGAGTVGKMALELPQEVMGR